MGAKQSRECEQKQVTSISGTVDGVTRRERYRIIDCSHEFKINNKETKCDDHIQTYLKIINGDSEKHDKSCDRIFNGTDDICIRLMVKYYDQVFVGIFTEYPGTILNLQRSFFNANGSKYSHEITKDGNLCVLITNTSTRPVKTTTQTRYVLKKNTIG